MSGDRHSRLPHSDSVSELEAGEGECGANHDIANMTISVTRPDCTTSNLKDRFLSKSRRGKAQLVRVRSYPYELASL